MRFLRFAIAAVALCTGQFLLVHSARQFYSEHWLFEATDLAKRDQYAQAEQAANNAARLDPQNGYALYQVAYTEYLLDKYDKAAQQAALADKLMPHRANLLRLRGECNYEAKDFASAANDLQQYFALVQVPPVNAGHLMKLAAISLFQQKRAGEAIFWLNRAAAVQASTFAEATQLKAGNAILLNDPEMAAAAVIILLGLPGGPQLNSVELLRNSMTAKKLPVLVSALEKVKQAYPDSPQLIQALAAAYVRNDKADSAVAVLKDAIAKNDADADLHFMLADVLFQQKNFTESTQHYDRVLALRPDFPQREEIERRKADMH